MHTSANARHIVGYELGFEGKIDWEKPVVFDLARIERIYKSECDRARFSVKMSTVDQVDFITKSSFDEVVERLGAIC